MNEKLTDDQILAAVKSEEQQAYGYINSDLSDDRSKALDSYFSRPMGNEVEDRSQVVMSDTLDTIETMMPQLLNIFTRSDDIVRFDPVGPEDEPLAEQETDYVNHVIMTQNKGFLILYQWFKDALLLKNGYVKVDYERRDTVEEEEYENLTTEQMMMLSQEEGVEIVNHTWNEEEDTHDVKIRITKTEQGTKITNIPPEEVLVSVHHRSVDLCDADFVQHRTPMTLSAIREMGYDVPDDIQDGEDVSLISDEAISRVRYSEEFDLDESVDPAMREVYLKDTYIRIDSDGDGKAELRHIVSIGEEMLENEVTDLIPIVAITPIVLSHQHIGMSWAELVRDLQDIHTTLMRQALDNMYNMNDQRTAISEYVNVSDMMESRPGGLVRMTDGRLPSEGHILPMPVQPLGQVSIQMMEHMESIKESRTSVTRYNQGLQADTLNKTATGMDMIMSASMMRLELVARVFAEVGVCPLVKLVHAVEMQNRTRAEVVQLRGEWVAINPREWKERKNLTVHVGLGTGNTEKQAAHINMIMEKQAMSPNVTPDNMYNAQSRMVENAGFKNPDEFFTHPSKMPPPPPPPEDPNMVMIQVNKQIEDQKAEIAAMKVQSEAMAKERSDELKAYELQLKEQAQQQSDQLEALQLQLESVTKDEDRDSREDIAQLNAEVKLMIEGMKNIENQVADIGNPGQELEPEHSFDPNTGTFI